MTSDSTLFKILAIKLMAPGILQSRSKSPPIPVGAQGEAVLKKVALRDLAVQIGSRRNWWLYPAEPKVEGFLGAGHMFIVGDQPSTAEWEYEHPHRRAFYDLLATEGAGDSHLTDIYKRRGPSGELRNGLPQDFAEHLEIFRAEVSLLNPTTIVALGWDAYELLLKHTPDLTNRIIRVWHFGTVRHARRF